MPSTSSPAADVVRARRARIARLDWQAERLDARFRVFGYPVGWDSILGLIPGVGDVVTAVPGLTMFYEARRMGARKRAMDRIAINTGIDLSMCWNVLGNDESDHFDHQDQIPDADFALQHDHPWVWRGVSGMCHMTETAKRNAQQLDEPVQPSTVHRTCVFGLHSYMENSPR